MIRFVRGNLFDSRAQTLVNSVNCVGVMGKGIAREFRDRWPEMYREYQAVCRRGELRSGRLFLYRELGRLILCVPTKDNWKGASKYEFIEAGLQAIRERYAGWGITSLAIPPLGCGLGGLDWGKVKPLIERYLADLPIDIEVFEPIAGDVRVDRNRPQRALGPVHMTLPLALLGEIIFRARQLMPFDVALGRLLVQKFAFFAQVAGAPLRLKFDKYKFGPYAHSLSHMIDRLEGLYIRDQSPTWDRSDIRILDASAWSSVVAPFSADIACHAKYLDASVDLLKTRPLEVVELLATVEYAWCALVSSGLAGTEEEVMEYVSEWSREKRAKFTAEDVRGALQTLHEAGWLGPLGTGRPSPLRYPAPEPGEVILA